MCPEQARRRNYQPIILIGAGGHCKACIDVIEQEGRFRIAGLVDVQEKLHEKVYDYEVMATYEDLPRLVDEFRFFLLTLGQMRSLENRIHLFDSLTEMGAQFPVIVSPLAYVSKHASIGKGTIVMHRALVNAGAHVGMNCIINCNAIVGHDAAVSDHCHIAMGAVVSWETKIQIGTFFESNSRPQQQIEIRGSHIIDGETKSVDHSSVLQSAQEIKLAVFGASGFSRETADILLCFAAGELIFIDLHPVKKVYFGFPIVSESEVPQLQKEGFLFAIGLGNNKDRKRIYEKFASLSFPNIIHPSATFGFRMSKAIANKKGNIITAGVRLANNIKMGNFGIFNLNSTVGHDCIIGDFVNIAPGANVSGNVSLAEGSYVGTSAAILQGKSDNNKMEIGRFATVGAGAVVTKNVPDRATVVGMPAKDIQSRVAL
jgi:sugar O-acyltransferase (sialic acid O-acetyltransferase NeuD family)